MRLHENKQLFADIIDAASRPIKEGGIGVLAPFIEKDYWITRSLQLMSKADNLDKAVFKGGTSLTKGYGIGNRFSEDIDIAIAEAWTITGNQLKMLIKRTSKAMTQGLVEVIKPSTSKGSRYHKAYYEYPRTSSVPQLDSFINTGELLVEINSFANPYPYEKRELTSFIYDFLLTHDGTDIIEEYDLQPFEVNILDKRRTLTEKMVSLFRASLGNDAINHLKAKIRHFYDLHHLWNDTECKAYLTDGPFLSDFNNLLDHDRHQFKEPDGWQNKSISNSPLLSNLPGLWEELRPLYQKELSHLAYTQIPDAASILQTTEEIMSLFH